MCQRDSFDLIKLVVRLEDRFDFSFADADLLFETVKSTKKGKVSK